MSESRTTGRDLIDFLDWAIDKNELVPSTASALRTGCLKVLEATDGWETQEVTPDVAAPYLERFRNANQNKLKERTRDAYARRFQQAVDMNARRAAGEEWKPKERATQRRPAPGAAASTRPSKEIQPHLVTWSITPSRCAQSSLSICSFLGICKWRKQSGSLHL